MEEFEQILLNANGGNYMINMQKNCIFKSKGRAPSCEAVPENYAPFVFGMVDSAAGEVQSIRTIKKVCEQGGQL